MLIVGKESFKRLLTNPVRSFAKKNQFKDVLDKPFTYEFAFNTLKNPMTEYVDLKANTLCDNKGARKARKRVGRGKASGLGKTAGKGHKGQGQRGTKKKAGFEGGQTPLHRRIPKMGMNKQNTHRLDYVNLHKLVYYIKRGFLTYSEEDPITIKKLMNCGAVTKVKYGVKLLGRGKEDLDQLGKPVFIELSEISEDANEAIKRNGGKVIIKYRTALKMKEHLYPELFDLPLREPLPAKKKIIQLEKYRDWGCEIDYNMPKWVKEELEKVDNLFKETERLSFQEVVDQRAKVKPILPKEYNFSS